jgi:branched-chain amino acid transport system substrate-binding protein
MHRRVWAASLVVLVLSLAAVAGTAGAGTRSAEGTQAAAPVKIGIVYSRTGLLSAYGAQFRQGLTFGMEYVTKGTNRINGRPVQIRYVDDAGDPAKAVAAARDLIGQGYKIIGGSTSSGVAV